jgi:hypothetical protein
MDECLRMLTIEPECPADELLAHQIRLQLIAEKVAQTSSNNTTFGYSDIPKTPLPFYLQAFRSQLIDVRRMISPEAERDRKRPFYDLSWPQYTDCSQKFSRRT